MLTTFMKKKLLLLKNIFNNKKNIMILALLLNNIIITYCCLIQFEKINDLTLEIEKMSQVLQDLKEKNVNQTQILEQNASVYTYQTAVIVLGGIFVMITLIFYLGGSSPSTSGNEVINDTILNDKIFKSYCNNINDNVTIISHMLIQASNDILNNIQESTKVIIDHSNKLHSSNNSNIYLSIFQKLNTLLNIVHKKENNTMEEKHLKTGGLDWDHTSLF